MCKYNKDFHTCNIRGRAASYDRSVHWSECDVHGSDIHHQKTNYMKTRSLFIAFFTLSFLILPRLSIQEAHACSTFKLQKGDKLLYAHNLNEGDIGVPGLVFVNKRGVFKTGRTWSELTTADRNNPSSHTWISRYGSITFNSFGRDLPDGGMNEAGLYIWEMNEDAAYPENTGRPKLDQMNWMQYLLDLYSTTEEAIACASEIEISGWGWHFFVGDANGNTAAIAFIDGEVVVHKENNMPVPALFNTPYPREMELLKYYQGYGGQYEINLDDPQVPRFVKTARLIEMYDIEQDIVDYGFYMLEKISVFDVPEWSVVFDASSGEVFFKTREHPGIKFFSLKEVDFSNRGPVTVLDMDEIDEGAISEHFSPYTHQIMKSFIRNRLVPILPEEFFTAGGLSLEEYIDRTARHSQRASLSDSQFFTGNWKTEEEEGLTLILSSDEDRILGSVSNGKDVYALDHLYMIANEFIFTFRTRGGRVMEAKARLRNDELKMELSTTENAMGSYHFYRQ